MDDRFHPALAALEAGNVEQMASLLDRDPTLATARSSVSHPTLLQCLVLTMPPVDTLETLLDLLASRGAELTDPLIAASGIDNTRAMRKLLDLGAEIEGNGRWSPLEEALYWGHDAAVKVLLERGASVRNLRAASAIGRIDELDHYFDEAGGLTPAAGEVAWPFGGSIPEDIRRDRQQVLDNALIYAAAWGQRDAVDRLVARGADVNHIPAGFDYAGTALHYAALNGRGTMVDHLLKIGADITIEDAKLGKLAADWAEHGGHKELSERLRNRYP